MSLSAESIIDQLRNHQSDAEYEKIRSYTKGDGPDNAVIGVRMRTVFDVAKEYRDLPPGEISRLLDSAWYEARMAAVSVMDFQVQSKKTSNERRRELFELYLNRHDRINNWDLVDRAAARVVGGFLADRPRDVLYELAGSEDVWERRTAIVATLCFLKNGETDDTYRLAERLLDDVSDTFTRQSVPCSGKRARRIPGA